jgi:CHASE2 domain-containing sensor protein
VRYPQAFAIIIAAALAMASAATWPPRRPAIHLLIIAAAVSALVATAWLLSINR